MKAGMRRKKSRAAVAWWEKPCLRGWRKSKKFHEKREACICKKYDADEIGQRILNGDGGSWIYEPYDPEAIFQLDRYHVYREMREEDP